MFNLQAGSAYEFVLHDRCCDGRQLGVASDQFDVLGWLWCFPMAAGMAALMRLMRRCRFLDRWEGHSAIGIVADGRGLSAVMVT